MPTYDLAPSFLRDWDKLTPAQREQFKRAIKKLVADLKRGHDVRPGLKVKKYREQEGIFEMAWAPDGRALFSYGTSPHPGDIHINWLRVGTHDIYEDLA